MGYIKFLILVPSLLICSGIFNTLNQHKKLKFVEKPLYFKFILNSNEAGTDYIDLNAIDLNDNKQLLNEDPQTYLSKGLILSSRDNNPSYYFYSQKKFSEREINFLKTFLGKIKNNNVLLDERFMSKLFLYLKKSDKYKQPLASQKEPSGITVFILLDKKKEKELKNTLRLFNIPFKKSDLENQTDEQFIENINNQYQKNIYYHNKINELKKFAHFGWKLFQFYSIYATFKSLLSLKSLPKMPHTTQQYIKTLWHFFIYLPTLMSLYHYSKIGFGALKTNVFKKRKR